MNAGHGAKRLGNSSFTMKRINDVPRTKNPRNPWISPIACNAYAQCDTCSRFFSVHSPTKVQARTSWLFGANGRARKQMLLFTKTMTVIVNIYWICAALQHILNSSPPIILLGFGLKPAFISGLFFRFFW
jgi:hypothetical protein